MAGRSPSPSPGDLALLDPDGSFRTRLAEDRARLAAATPAELAVIIHRLAGAAATFGYADLGDLAITLDEILAAGRPLPGDSLTGLLAVLDQTLKKSA